MADIEIPTPTANALLDALAVLVDADTDPGYVELRSGTKPAADSAPSDGDVLAIFTLADPSFAAAASRSMELDTDPVLTDEALESGDASYARVYDGADTLVFQGDVGTSGTPFIITQVAITSGQTVNLTVGTLNY